MNPATCAPGDVIAEGEYCRIVLAVDSRGRMPVQDDFFHARGVGPEDKKKMVAALKNFSRTGPTNNPERYKRLDDFHYLKIHAFRVYGLERVCQGVREVVVCHIEEKKQNKALPDGLKDKSWRRFESHCERYRP